MKTAIIVDKEKIGLFKLKIKQKAYVDHAVDQLAYEIARIFL